MLSASWRLATSTGSISPPDEQSRALLIVEGAHHRSHVNGFVGTSDFSGVELRNVVRRTIGVVRLGGCVSVGYVVHLFTDALLDRVARGSGRELEVHTTVAVGVRLTERGSGRVLFEHPVELEVSLTYLDMRA